MKQYHISELRNTCKTPKNDESKITSEYRLTLENSKKQLSGRHVAPKYHSDSKKDIQKKIRRLVENRNIKKTLFESSSYHDLYNRDSRMVARQPLPRSLSKSI
jgi:hypothetical protein